MTEKNRINDKELDQITGGTETEVPACIEQYSENKTVNGKRKRYSAIWEVRLHTWDDNVA